MISNSRKLPPGWRGKGRRQCFQSLGPVETGTALGLSCGSWRDTATGGDNVEMEKRDISLLLLLPALLSSTTASHWPNEAEISWQESLEDAAFMGQPLQYRAGQRKSKASTSKAHSTMCSGQLLKAI